MTAIDLAPIASDLGVAADNALLARAALSAEGEVRSAVGQRLERHLVEETIAWQTHELILGERHVDRGAPIVVTLDTLLDLDLADASVNHSMGLVNNRHGWPQTDPGAWSLEPRREVGSLLPSIGMEYTAGWVTFGDGLRDPDGAVIASLELESDASEGATTIRVQGLDVAALSGDLALPWGFKIGGALYVATDTSVSAGVATLTIAYYESQLEPGAGGLQASATAGDPVTALYEALPLELESALEDLTIHFYESRKARRQGVRSAGADGTTVTWDSDYVKKLSAGITEEWGRVC